MSPCLPFHDSDCCNCDTGYSNQDHQSNNQTCLDVSLFTAYTAQTWNRHAEHTTVGEKATELLLRPVPTGSHFSSCRYHGSTAVAFRCHTESLLTSRQERPLLGPSLPPRCLEPLQLPHRSPYSSKGPIAHATVAGTSSQTAACSTSTLTLCLCTSPHIPLSTSSSCSCFHTVTLKHTCTLL